jgi:glycolate oxidase
LPEILAYVEAVAQKYQVRIFNVFHAGDGNIHPILLFDERDTDLMQRMKQASHDILVRCIEMGGTVTGEHGIGVEKREFMPLMFSAATLELFHELRVAFTKNVKLSPGKML